MSVAAGWLGSCWLMLAAAPLAEPPAALLGDSRIEWSELQSHVAEAAGGQILEEIVLGRALKQVAAARGVKIEQTAIDLERGMLTGALARAAGVPESDGAALLERVRTNRGLGPERFAALLERNAMLRALVRAESGSGGGTAGDVTRVSDEDLREAYALKYGMKIRTRLILVRSEKAAQEAVGRLAGGESFAEVAAQISVDPSAAVGGLLDPFSPADPNYPAAVRKVASELGQGKVSPPIGVSWGGNQGYALLKVEERIEPPATAPTLEAVAEELRAEVRLVRERAAMDRLARRLIAESKVTVFDRSLGWSWEKRSEAR
ncbi:MAG: peptidylprolyl isomerase [Phycisphaerales bacterium]